MSYVASLAAPYLRVPFWVGLFALLACLLLGGGTRQNLPSDTILQVLSLPLLAVGGSWLVVSPGTRRLKWPLLVGATIAIVPLIQLIPLPPALWSAFPGRTNLAAQYEWAGLPTPWQPLTMSTSATWESFLSLVPPLAIFVATLVLSYRERRALSLVLIAYGLGSVVLGMAQVAQGVDSPLRFFKITNDTEAVGFFANRNHFAAALYCLMPLAAAWSIGLAMKSERRRRSKGIEPSAVAALIGSLFAFSVLLLGEGLARSRAGLAVAAVAGLASLLLALPYRKRQIKAQTLKVVFAGASVMGLLVALYAGYRFIQRFDVDPVDDIRFQIAATALQAAVHFFPIGAGIGTFDTVYELFETPDQLTGEYINRAHNDFLESLIEGGLLTTAVLAAFMVWLVGALRRVWGRGSLDLPSIDASLARAAGFVPVLLILHSAVDYPMRTDAMMAVAAFACGLLAAPIVTEPEQSESRDRRHHRSLRASSGGVEARSRRLQEAVGE